MPGELRAGHEVHARLEDDLVLALRPHDILDRGDDLRACGSESLDVCGGEKADVDGLGQDGVV